jgi:DNA-binding NarL/FixJ family response regulator
MKTEIRIIIADDHPIFRRGLRSVIEGDASLKVIDEADDGNSALEKIASLKPDIVVLDVNMPDLTGFEVVRRAQQQRLNAEIIFLTMHKDEEMFNTAMDLGVRGYVLKDSAVTEVVGAIKAVAAGKPFISPMLSEFLLSRSSRSSALSEKTPSLKDLTPTEKRILKMVAEYKTSKEIADVLCIHSRTVDNHRTNISQKLELHGSHSLLKFALEHKSEL